MAPLGAIATFLHSQIFVTPKKPTDTFAGKTVIVTGSNVGLGKEAARHYARLGASTVILAVRNVDKGEAAKKDIDQSTGCGPDVVKVWQLDLSSYQSVKDFAAKASKELTRLDVLLENAAISTYKFSVAEDNETSITVNVVSTFLLAFLMLPKLKETARKFNVRPVLTIVSSEAHIFASFAEKKAPEGQIFKTLNDKATANMLDRYPVSKLLELFVIRSIGENAPAESYPITVNCLNPGFCHSELAREVAWLSWLVWLLKLLLAQSTEVGSRTLVNATTSGPETHGAYLSDCVVAQPSPYVRSEDGQKMQKRVWDELTAKLEAIEPGVTSNL